MLIDYECSVTFNNTLEVSDPGNVCIICQNEEFYQWYLVIKSIRGNSHILKYGPIIPDADSLEEDFELTYSKIKFNEKTLHFTISKFINDSKKCVKEARVCNVENAFDDFPNIAKLYKNLS